MLLNYDYYSDMLYLYSWLFLKVKTVDILNLILIIVAVAAAFFAWSQIFGAPWWPTPYRTVRRMLELARIKPGEKVYDLGSGDGRIIIEAARLFGARATGIEIDPIRYFYTQIRILRWRLRDRVHVLLGNFFYKDLSEADVVMIYLLQDTNLKLIRKFIRELRPGTRIVTNTFTLPGMKIIRQNKKDQIYVYKI